MKSAKEIAARAIILLCLSDRCALERETIGNQIYTFKQKEEQRQAIYSWIQRTGYIHFMTLEEKLLFEQPVDKGDKVEILSKQLQYEAIEPCLWTLGLKDELSKYDHFVIDDFHPILEIEVAHTLESLLLKCCLRNNTDIVLQNEIAMLWHWRARELNNSIFKFKPVEELIIAAFGAHYSDNVSQLKKNNTIQSDFIVNNRPFSSLNLHEMNQVKLIAQWRQHAFEWILGNEAWDEVELNT